MSPSNLGRAYALLLQLYPRAFRDQFGREMSSVFEQALAAAAGQGAWAVAALCARELRDWPGAVSRQHSRAIQDHAQSRPWSATGTLPEVTMSTPSPSRWGAGLAAALPFLAFGLCCLISRLPGRPLDSSVMLLFLLFATVVGLGAGLARGFPRWAYAYLAWAIVSAWAMMSLGRPVLPSERLPASAYVPWGWLSWIPLGVTLAGAVLLARSWRPLRPIVVGLWHDWSLLSLGMYTLLSFAFVLYDENHSPFLLAFIAASTLVSAAGAWAYVQARRPLLGALGLAIASLALLDLDRVNMATWDFRAYYHLAPAAGGWLKAASDLGLLALILAALMLLPALIRQLWHARPRGSQAQGAA